MRMSADTMNDPHRRMNARAVCRTGPAIYSTPSFRVARSNDVGRCERYGNAAMAMMRAAIGIAAVLPAFAGVSLAIADARRPTTPPTPIKQRPMQTITLRIGDRNLTATLYDNPTARDFAETLPFEANLHDLFRQEKAGRTARALSTAGPAQRTFTAGDIGYWSPSRDVALYYRAGDRLPAPGIIMIGRIEGDVALLDRPGDVRIRFSRR